MYAEYNTSIPLHRSSSNIFILPYGTEICARVDMHVCVQHMRNIIYQSLYIETSSYVVYYDIELRVYMYSVCLSMCARDVYICTYVCMQMCV